MSEFAQVLRAWRDRVRPQDVGFPVGTGRRTPGLRREELAALAGVSVEYLVRLEQGRARNPSPQMLGALARALRLSTDERDHLYRVAGVAAPSAGMVPRHVTAGVQRLVDRFADVPLAVFTASWDLLLWNPMWAALCGDSSNRPALERNVAWRHFVVRDDPIDYDTAHHEQFGDDLAADLRAAVGRYPADQALASLITRLRGESAEFERRWGYARVARHQSSLKTVTSTPVGPITIDCDVLTVPDNDLRVVVYSAAPGTESAARMELLTVIGVQALA